LNVGPPAGPHSPELCLQFDHPHPTPPSMRKLLHNPTVPLVGLIVAIVLFPVAAWLAFAVLITRDLSGQAMLLNQMLTESRQLYNETLGAGLAEQEMETTKIDLR